MPTCDAPSRYGTCLLEPGHTGYHATVVFMCEGCGKTRRGRAHRTGREYDGTPMHFSPERYWPVSVPASRTAFAGP